jgi:hypothetical protein
MARVFKPVRVTVTGSHRYGCGFEGFAVRYIYIKIGSIIVVLFNIYLQKLVNCRSTLLCPIEFSWTPCGLHNSTETPHGLHMDSMWTPKNCIFFWLDSRGLHMDSTWTPHRLHWTPHGLTPCGLCNIGEVFF